ncbi:hypothetical protein H5410_049105, partial [Solanum commersonii]
VVEVGELSEIFQWKGEVPRGLPNLEEQHLGEQLSNVVFHGRKSYLVLVAGERIGRLLAV